MPFSIKNIFSNPQGKYPEISGPVQDKSVPKNCTLISTTCSIKSYTIFNIKSCGFDIRPPGTGDRTPQLRFSASELLWLSKTTETEIHNTKE